MSLFIVNYKRELNMGVDIRKKGKVEKVMEFVERIKKHTRESRNSVEKSLKESEVVSK